MAKKAAKKAAKKVAEKVKKPKAAAKKAEVPKKTVKAKPTKEKSAPKKVVTAESAPSAKKVDRSQLSDEAKKWLDLYEKHGGNKAPSYDMRAEFLSQTPIAHKIFGWGWILKSENNRLEVLFENGVQKSLICNYKP